jgi:hypothetical protein
MIQTPIAPNVHPKMKTGKEFPSACIRFPSSPSLVRGAPLPLRNSALECADMSALWFDATCRVGGKRQRVAALQKRCHVIALHANCPNRPSQNENRNPPSSPKRDYGATSPPKSDFRHRPASCVRPAPRCPCGIRMAIVPFQSARGLAHSRTLRVRRVAPNIRQVLDCGGPLPLFPGFIT